MKLGRNLVVVSDAMGVELFFLAQTASGSGAAGRFCTALPQSPLLFGGISLVSRSTQKK